MFYVGVSGGEWIADHLPLPFYIAAGILMVSISFDLTFLYELLYADLFLWAAIGLYNRRLDKPTTNRFYNGLLSVSRVLLDRSIDDFDQNHPIIERIYDRELGSSATGQRWIAYVVSGLTGAVVLGLFVLVALPLAFLLDIGIGTASVMGITMFTATVPVSAVVQFIYARYGASTFDQVASDPQLLYLLPLVYGLLLLHAGVL